MELVRIYFRRWFKRIQISNYKIYTRNATFSLYFSFYSAMKTLNSLNSSNELFLLELLSKWSLVMRLKWWFLNRCSNSLLISLTLVNRKRIKRQSTIKRGLISWGYLGLSLSRHSKVKLNWEKLVLTSRLRNIRT